MFHAGQYEEAIMALERAIELNPNNDLAWVTKGEALRRAGMYEEAITALGKATDLKPDHDLAWALNGYALLEAGRYEEAIAALGKATDLNPNNEWAWALKGDALLQAGRYEEAYTALDRATKLNPDNDWPWARKGQALGNKAIRETDETRRRELLEEAISAFRKAIEANARNNAAWINLSTALIEMWRVSLEPYLLEEALAAAQRVASLGGGRYNLACALALSGRIDDSFTELLRSLTEKEISWSDVDKDSDWEQLRDRPEYKRLQTQFASQD